MGLVIIFKWLLGTLIGIGLIALSFVYYQSAKTAIILESPQNKIVKEIRPKLTNTPSGAWGDILVFGDKGETVIAGSTSILFSPDEGKSWRKLSGGKGRKNVSKDGGITYEKYEEFKENRKSAIPNWVDAKQLCSVEGAQIESSS